MTDDRDPPIVEIDYRSGTTVVDIGDIRVARGLTRRPRPTCSHPKLLYDPRERRVWCPDCESNVDPFDAFCGIVDQFYGAYKDLEREHDDLVKAQEKGLSLLAARNLETAWRKRKSIPCCPSCNEPLFADDFKDPRKIRLASRDLAMRNRQNKSKKR